ncbi:MAG TPA: nuclear transport factor 2 family protein [Candidatus Limnocylindrales bacterium]
MYKVSVLVTALTALLAVTLSGCADTNGSPSVNASSASGSPASGPPAPAVDPGALMAPVRAFVDAVAAKDADKVVAAFADNGVVIDVSRRIEGREAIRRWAANETITGTLTVLQIAESGTDRQRLLVRFAPGGSGGFQASYAFTVAGGRISLLDMQYA